MLSENLWINGGKTQVWNQAGVRPDACDVLERIAQESDLQARVWKGPGLPKEKQGMKVSGAPLGRPSFVHAFLVKKIEDQRTLLDRIPLLADLQASWLLLLHCAAARANYLLRVVEPGAAAQYVSSHEGLRICLCAISPDLGDERRNNHAFGSGRDWTAQRNAYKTPAFWASWSVSWAMIHARHWEVASQFVVALEQGAEGPCLMAVAEARRTLTGVRGFGLTHSNARSVTGFSRSTNFYVRYLSVVPVVLLTSPAVYTAGMSLSAGQRYLDPWTRPLVWAKANSRHPAPPSMPQEIHRVLSENLSMRHHESRHHRAVPLCAETRHQTDAESQKKHHQ